MKHKRTHSPTALRLASLCVALLAAGCASAWPDPTTPAGATPVPEAAFVQSGSKPGATKEVKSPLPPPTGYVNDYAKVLDAKTKQALEEKLWRLKKRANIEFAVALVETTGDVDIFDYSLAVGIGWGIGPPAGEDGGGILLLLATKDRLWHIHVSRKLEADLPKDVLAEIGGRMIPSLRQGNYDEAVVKCVDDLIKRLAERRTFKPE
ncbi:MAG: TPM domain-containing protein [Acidobacteria bacterium]|nr:TPM domain-containing protein [Acidobacteriota bacterium]